ncbi:MAG: DUF6377 domain-containing protein [Tannerellaceae bacterium]|nr:DUF6377 domain-containing protein [Tannerellaceae bacterium]
MLLNKIIDNKDSYAIIKEQNIRDLKQMFNINNLSQKQRYDINLKLYEEYKKYQSDSAEYYIIENKNIASYLEDEELQYESEVLLASLYSTKGMYIEAKEMLKSIDKTALPYRLLPVYYDTYTNFCSHYGQSNQSYVYYKQSEFYRDTLLFILDTQSLHYRIEQAKRMLFKGEEVENILLSLLDITTDKNPERAEIAYLLGSLYKNKGEVELQKKYYAVSIITDIINCIKDNASLQSLALTYYQIGDVDQAYRFFNTAIDDAVFCNVRYRMSEASMIYPIINETYRAKEIIQKSRLQRFLILISVLSVFLIAGISYIYIQMKRLNRIRQEISLTNVKLSNLNNELLEANNSLNESNHIKEEYIAHFFNVCSSYITKQENYRKILYKHAKNNNKDELFKILQSTSFIENELEELYKKFDSIFLSLYPSFVEEFNALRIKEEQIVLKPGELLNTELRIFALIRLGINDNVKIAGFLRYSLSTIYNYRVKARNSAFISRDEFDKRILKIGL